MGIKKGKYRLYKTGKDHPGYKNGNPSLIHGTFEYFRCHSWQRINSRAINGTSHNPKVHISYAKKKILLKMTKDEYYNWCLKNKKIIVTLYKSGKSPSVDRINELGPYSIDNIRILEWGENACRQKRKKIEVSINGTNSIFDSIKAAAKHFKIKRESLSLIAKGLKKHKTIKARFLV